MSGRPHPSVPTSPWPFETARANAEVLIDERIPVLNLSLGIAPDIADAVHAYGGRVVSTVTTRRHARKAAASGADALIVTGHEAAGHGSGISSLVLVPLIAAEVDVPVIASGGFVDGGGLAAALVLWAPTASRWARASLSVRRVPCTIVSSQSCWPRARATQSSRIGSTDSPSRLLDSRRAAALASLTGPLHALRRLPGVRRSLGLSWGQVLAIAVRAGRDLPGRIGSLGLAGDTFAAVARRRYRSRRGWRSVRRSAGSIVCSTVARSSRARSRRPRLGSRDATPGRQGEGAVGRAVGTSSGSTRSQTIRVNAFTISSLR